MMLGYISSCSTREHKISQTPNLLSLILVKETLKPPIYLHCLNMFSFMFFFGRRWPRWKWIKTLNIYTLNLYIYIIVFLICFLHILYFHK